MDFLVLIKVNLVVVLTKITKKMNLDNNNNNNNNNIDKQ